jgi:hypothetical protein
MNKSRADTLFCLRYAVRVLERYARLWRRVDASLRVAALFSGSAAFAALVAGNQGAVITAGVMFAALQAIEYGLSPSRIEQDARAARALYADILPLAAGLGDTELEAAYQGAVAKDEVTVPESLRRAAYNDVLLERGGNSADQFVLTPWQRVVSFIG